MRLPSPSVLKQKSNKYKAAEIFYENDDEQLKEDSEDDE